MALTELIRSIAGIVFRQRSGNPNDVLERELVNNKIVSYDGAASEAVSGGDIDIDLSATFSSIENASIQLRENTAYVFAWDSGATAGHLKFRVFVASTGVAVAGTPTVDFGYTVTGVKV